MLLTGQAMNNRWMQFVDGENITCRTQELVKKAGFDILDGPTYQRDVFLWPAEHPAAFGYPPWIGNFQPLRSYYYTSAKCDQPGIEEIERKLRHIGFEPHVFKKDRPNEKAKGVDIALTKDMLSHAFRDNYDAAVLVTGDGDYLPLIDEVKRLGKLVYIFFIEEFTHPRLQVGADRFVDKTEQLREWGTSNGRPRPTVQGK